VKRNKQTTTIDTPIRMEDLFSGIFDAVRAYRSVTAKHPRRKLPYASKHEMLGVIDEEVDEFKLAIRSNKPARIKAELIDIVVAGLHGLATMRSRKRDNLRF
jgi:hypothetical protein